MVTRDRTEATAIIRPGTRSSRPAGSSTKAMPTLYSVIIPTSSRATVPIMTRAGQLALLAGIAGMPDLIEPE